MHPSVECIMHNKRILLFKEMLDEIGFTKVDDLIHYLTTGFPWLAVSQPQGCCHRLRGPQSIRSMSYGCRPR